jgi:hypothetical protein
VEASAAAGAVVVSIVASVRARGFRVDPTNAIKASEPAAAAAISHACLVDCDRLEERKLLFTLPCKATRVPRVCHHSSAGSGAGLHLEYASDCAARLQNCMEVSKTVAVYLSNASL